MSTEITTIQDGGVADHTSASAPDHAAGSSSLVRAFTGVAATAVCDTVAAVIAFGLVNRSVSAPQIALSEIYLPLLAFPFGLALAKVGEPAGRGAAETLRTRVVCALQFCLGFLVWEVFTGRTAYAWVALLALPLFLTVSAILDAMVRPALSRAGVWSRDAVVIGSGEAAQSMALMLKSAPEIGLRPIGIVDRSCGAPADGGRLLGILQVRTLAELPEAARRGAVAVVVSAGLQDDQAARRFPFREVIVVPDLSDMQALGLRAGSLNGLVALFSRPNAPAWHHGVKAAVDRLAGLVLLAGAAPVIAGLALVVRIASPGPAFYSQQRIGCGGRPFAVWKLRTMHVDADARLSRLLKADPSAAEEWNRCFKLTNDPRIIPWVGQLLRRFSLDELPQLWNVVRGDMSLVGPRPFPPYHLARFDESFRRLRMNVPPGLTGLWQIAARSDGDLFVQRQLDLHYIRNWSLWLDLHILILTLYRVVSGAGAR